MIHPTACVDPAAALGADIEVGPYAVIEAGAIIGSGCRIGAHAVVHRGSRLGASCHLSPHAVVGGDPQDLRFDSRTESGVLLGVGVVVREGVTIHRSTKPGSFTEVSDGALLMVNCHVAHDCRIGAKAILANGVLLAGHVEIGAGCFLGGNAVVHQFTRMGEGAILGGLSGIGLDQPPFTLAAGRNHLGGFNLVGLKRRGCRRETIAELKQAWRLVFAGGAVRPHAEKALAEGGFTSVEARAFLEFFLSGKRGFLRPGRAVEVGVAG